MAGRVQGERAWAVFRKGEGMMGMNGIKEGKELRRGKGKGMKVMVCLVEGESERILKRRWRHVNVCALDGRGTSRWVATKIGKEREKAVWDSLSECENKTTKNHQITASSLLLQSANLFLRWTLSSPRIPRALPI